MPSTSQKRPRKRKGWIFWTLVLLLLIMAGGTAAWQFKGHRKPVISPLSSSPVPRTVAQAVNFPVYYPQPSKLPTGYSLDKNSFSTPVKNGVSYKVTYDKLKKIVFSLQTRPSDNELESFKSNYIPLRVSYQTPIGQAEIGAYHSQTLVSLPVFNGPWIIITAPPDINQDDLKTILSALKH